MWLINGAQLDLIQLQLKSGAALCQCDGLDSLWLLIDMMPEADEVILVGKCHHTFAVILCSRKKILQDVHNMLPQLCAEVVQYQVRVCL